MTDLTAVEMFLQELGQHSDQAGRTPRMYISYDTSDWQLHADLNSNRTDLFSFNRLPGLAKQLDEHICLVPVLRVSTSLRLLQVVLGH